MNKLLYFFKVKKAAVGSGILIFFISIAIFAPIISPYKATQNSFYYKKAPKKIKAPIFEKKIIKKIFSDIDKEYVKSMYHKDEDKNYYILNKRLKKEEKKKIADIISLIEIRFGLRETPSIAHPFGTTSCGYDLFSRVIIGTRVSLFVGIVCGVFAGIIALIMGLVSGYFGGIIDDILSMIINVFLVIPAFVLMIVFASYIPVKGILPIVIIISITSWAYGARLFRSQVLTLRNRDFVKASIVVGERSSMIIFTDILPNMLSLIIANFFAACLSAILFEAALEFLGLGDASVVSWGNILFWAQNGGAMINNQWQWIVIPGLCIASVGTSFALLNFAVDEIANPKLRSMASIKVKRRKLK